VLEGAQMQDFETRVTVTEWAVLEELYCWPKM
jgi:hypothetical protein